MSEIDDTTRTGQSNKNNGNGKDKYGHIPELPYVIALRCATRGSPVFPCNASRTPLFEGGPINATCDIGQVKAWWQKYPEALVGVLTGPPESNEFMVLPLDYPADEKERRARLDSPYPDRIVQLADPKPPDMTLSELEAAGYGPTFDRSERSEEQIEEDRLRQEWLQVSFEADQDRFWNEICLTEPTPPPVLIPSLIPCDAVGLVGPGGSAKSTFATWLAMHIVLGRPVFGREIVSPGECVYISAEDTFDVIAYRIRQLGDAMELSRSDWLTLAQGFHVQDWVGQERALVRPDIGTALGMTPWVDAIATRYAKRQIKMMIFDPAVYFGPGERWTNDGEAKLMQAVRRIGRLLGGTGPSAATCVVHHTGKTVARDKTVDQYAGRGGSAFADQSRAQLIMHRHDADVGDIVRPPGVTDRDMEDGRAYRLHVAKFSVGPQELRPFWLVRDIENPWRFYDYSPLTDDEAKRHQSRQAEDELSSNIRILKAFLHSEARLGHYYTSREIDDSMNRIGLSRAGIREAIIAGKHRGEFAEHRESGDLRKATLRVMDN